MPEIEITINDDTGEVIYEVSGIKGKDCEALTKELDEALGTVVKNKKLPEFFQQQKQQQKHRS